MSIPQLMEAASRRLVDQAAQAGLFREDARGELGRVREGYVREFLAGLLPARFAVGNGLILLTADSVSSQQDVIIFDRLNHSPLDSSPDCQLYTADSVHSTIEVKTRLTRSEFQASCEKIAVLKRGLRASPREFLAPTLPETLCSIFAFQGPSAADLHEWMVETLRETAMEDRPDFVCIPGAGLSRSGTCFDVAMYGEKGSEFRENLGDSIKGLRSRYPHGISTWETHHHSLFLFTFLSMSYLLRKGPTIPNWSNYVDATHHFSREVGLPAFTTTKDTKG